MIATGKRYIQKHVQERRNPKRLPTVEDLQALHARIEKQAHSAEGQIALILDDHERLPMLSILLSLRARQEELAQEIDNRLARNERRQGPPPGNFQLIGDVLERMNDPAPAGR